MCAISGCVVQARRRMALAPLIVAPSETKRNNNTIVSNRAGVAHDLPKAGIEFATICSHRLSRICLWKNGAGQLRPALARPHVSVEK